MARIVLRVRLCSGDHLDVVYDDPEAADDEELIQHVIDTLSQEDGSLRTLHGGRLLVLFSRGVAAIELAPRGAVL